MTPTCATSGLRQPDEILRQKWPSLRQPADSLPPSAASPSLPAVTLSLPVASLRQQRPYSSQFQPRSLWNSVHPRLIAKTLRSLVEENSRQRPQTAPRGRNLPNFTALSHLSPSPAILHAARQTVPTVPTDCAPEPEATTAPTATTIEMMEQPTTPDRATAAPATPKNFGILADDVLMSAVPPPGATDGAMQAKDENDSAESVPTPDASLPAKPKDFQPRTCVHNRGDDTCHLNAFQAPKRFRAIGKWRGHVHAHLNDKIVQLRDYIPELAAVAGWRYSVTCDKIRKPGKGGQPDDREEAFLRLACEPGQPCLAYLDPEQSPSVKMQTGARRAKKRQRDLTDLEARTRARVLAPQPERAPPTSEEILLAKFWPSKVFEIIPRCCLQKERKAHLSTISHFSYSTPESDGADFLNAEDQASPEQYLSFLRVYCVPQAVLRRLYPGEDGAGDTQAEDASLRAILHRVAHDPTEVFARWWA